MILDHLLGCTDKQISGEDIIDAQEEQEETKIIDIMEVLRASLASNESSSKPKWAAKKKPPAKSNKAKVKGKGQSRRYR